MKNNKFLAYFTLVFAGIGISQVFNYSTESESDGSLKQSFNEDYKVYALPVPEKMVFADENIPLQIDDIKEKLDRELLVNTYWQSNMLLYIKRAHKYFPVIEPILKEQGIPDDFKYLALIESGLTNVVSPSGAAGFWQIMESTGKEYGLEINSEVDERYHLEKATMAATKYLNEAYERYGDWTLAAGSYNMGMNGMDRQLERQKVSNYFDLLLNSETGRYVYRILAVKEIMADPSAYGFQVRQKDLWTMLPTESMEIDTAVKDLAQFSIDQGINYKMLKQYNPWLRKGQLSNSSGKSYQFEIPLKTNRAKLLSE